MEERTCPATIFLATLHHCARLVLLHELLVDLGVFGTSVGGGIVVHPRIRFVLGSRWLAGPFLLWVNGIQWIAGTTLVFFKHSGLQTGKSSLQAILGNRAMWRKEVLGSFYSELSKLSSIWCPSSMQTTLLPPSSSSSQFYQQQSTTRNSTFNVIY